MYGNRYGNTRVPKRENWYAMRIFCSSKNIGHQKRRLCRARLYPFWINFWLLWRSQNELFPVNDILLFKEGRYFSSYLDRVMVCGAPIPVRPYPIPITLELKRTAELIWSLKPQFCFGYNIFLQSLVWIKTEDNRWLVVNRTTEQVFDAQVYLDSLDKDET